MNVAEYQDFTGVSGENPSQMKGPAVHFILGLGDLAHLLLSKKSK